MRCNKRIVLLLTLLLSIVAIFGGLWELNEQVPFLIRIPTAEGEEIINCWKNGSTNYYVFLPSYANLNEVEFCSIKDNRIFINNQPLVNGMTCANLQKDTVYDCVYTVLGRSRKFSVTFVQSENMPTMYIDVPSGNMDYIHEEKGNEETGQFRLYTKSGALDYIGKLDSIKGRGNATWNREKKAYSLVFDNDANLLGMGDARKWILLANAYDPSHLRNKIAYDMAKAADMKYSPDCEWVDLYLNGEYTGLYLLSERNEVHPERVDISSDNSFLVSREGESRLINQGIPYFLSDWYLALRIHHSSMSVAEIDEIWQPAENAIFAKDGIDPLTGKNWLDLIDLDSWVRKFLIDEVLANYDGGGISQFFYFDGNDPSGKIYAGPIWDMDVTLSPGQWEISYPNSFTARRPYSLHEMDNAPFFALYQKDAFYERMVELYQSSFRPQVVKLLKSGLDQYAEQILQAAELNQLRWNIKDYNEEIEVIRVFLEERLSFLDEIWISGREFCDVLVVIDGEVWAWFAVQKGEVLPQISELEDCEWYTVDTDRRIDITQPIFESVNIYTQDY